MICQPIYGLHGLPIVECMLRPVHGIETFMRSPCFLCTRNFKVYHNMVTPTFIFKSVLTDVLRIIYAKAYPPLSPQKRRENIGLDMLIMIRPWQDNVT